MKVDIKKILLGSPKLERKEVRYCWKIPQKEENKGGIFVEIPEIVNNQLLSEITTGEENT